MLFSNVDGQQQGATWCVAGSKVLDLFMALLKDTSWVPLNWVSILPLKNIFKDSYQVKVSHLVHSHSLYF